MATEKSVSSGGGIGIGGALAVLFVGLKLTGHIDWSWWWVLSPLWLGATVVVVFAAVFFIVALLMAMVGK